MRRWKERFGKGGGGSGGGDKSSQDGGVETVGEGRTKKQEEEKLSGEEGEGGKRSTGTIPGWDSDLTELSSDDSDDETLESESESDKVSTTCYFPIVI